jgi:Leucine-rich repeat (LRR) protein
MLILGCSNIVPKYRLLSEYLTIREMNCFTPEFQMRARCSSMMMPWMILLIGLSYSCNPSGRGITHGDHAVNVSVKPATDSTKVISTLDLYRAKRFESLKEALDSETEEVHKLILYDCGLTLLPPEIGKLTYLASLDVSYNELTEIPEVISALHYLQGFYATHNQLTRFPHQLLLLPLLTRIDLSGNQIDEIPPEIGYMDQLTRLTMDQNVLTSLPMELYSLDNLTVLELADNTLRALPKGISGLGSLKKLDVSGNQLTGLPREISTLANHLEELNIQRNPIPPEEIQWLEEAMPSTQIRY